MSKKYGCRLVIEPTYVLSTSAACFSVADITLKRLPSKFFKSCNFESVSVPSDDASFEVIFTERFGFVHLNLGLRLLPRLWRHPAFQTEVLKELLFVGELLPHLGKVG